MNESEQVVAPATPKPEKKKKRVYTPEEMARFKKTGRKSSKKGKRRENEFAKALSKWWTAGKTNKAFRRTPLSGGFPKRGSHGDIIPIDPVAQLFPFVIDVKDRKNVNDLEFADMLVREKCPLFKWWAELEAVIRDNPQFHAGKMRLMIIHKKQKDYCMVGGKELDYITSNAGRLPVLKIAHPFGEEPLYVFHLTSLFEKDPETLKSVKV